MDSKLACIYIDSEVDTAEPTWFRVFYVVKTRFYKVHFCRRLSLFFCLLWAKIATVSHVYRYTGSRVTALSVFPHYVLLIALLFSVDACLLFSSSQPDTSATFFFPSSCCPLRFCFVKLRCAVRFSCSFLLLPCVYSPGMSLLCVFLSDLSDCFSVAFAIFISFSCTLLGVCLPWFFAFVAIPTFSCPFGFAPSSFFLLLIFRFPWSRLTLLLCI